MEFKRTLTGIVIATSLGLPVARADESSAHPEERENKIQYEKRNENPIYPIIFMAGSLAVACGAAYYAIREGRKNDERLDNK